MNYLMVDALRKYAAYYGNDFRIECPTNSGQMLTLAEIADELTARLARLFLRGPDGSRPSQGRHPTLALDPHFRDHLLFHEYLHGDDGRGLGASHQTGWTGLIATLLSERQPKP